MRVLIDTNILLTYLSGREDRYSDECEKIIEMCSDGHIEGIVAFHSLSTIWYVTRKFPEEIRRGYIKRICLLMTISAVDNDAVLRAVEDDHFPDFEDALQDSCAQETECDYIITANLKDFSGHSHVSALTPDMFLSKLQETEK